MTQNLQSLVAKDANLGSQLGCNILNLNDDISAVGVHAIYETDFNAYRDAAVALTDRCAITGVFDPEKCRIDSENGFWIRGVDDENNTVHVQALRYDDLNGSSLAQHWWENRELFGPAGMNVDIERSNFNTAPVAHEISGGVCYHGDLFMSRGARKIGLAKVLAQMAMLVALARFRPNFLYGLIEPRNVRKGLAAQFGYLHTHPWGPSWTVRGESEPYDDYLVWTTDRELDDLLNPGKRDRLVENRFGQANERRPSIKTRAANK